MDAMGRYMKTIIAAAMICSLILPLLQENTIGKTVKLLCRIYLLISIVHPFLGKILPEISVEEWLNHWDASREIQAGEDYVRRNKMEFIKRDLESYIVDKASSWGEPVSVEVHLSDENMLPQDVVIAGSLTPEKKFQLENIMETDLGITKENQMWIGTD